MHNSIRTIGMLLKDRRKVLGLSINEAAEAIKVRPKYLSAIEEGDVEEMPVPPYNLGYTRNYAIYLGFDGNEIIAKLKAAEDALGSPNDLYLPETYRENFCPSPMVLLLSVVLLLGIYGVWRYQWQAKENYSSQISTISTKLSEYSFEDSLKEAPASKTARQKPDYAVMPLLTDEAQEGPIFALFASENSWFITVDKDNTEIMHYLRKGERYYIYDADAIILGDPGKITIL